jgi:uncharacterized protein YbjQ (UPF0145 family)
MTPSPTTGRGYEEGKKIIEVLGIVRGASVRGVGWMKVME